MISNLRRSTRSAVDFVDETDFVRLSHNQFERKSDTDRHTASSNSTTYAHHLFNISVISSFAALLLIDILQHHLGTDRLQVALSAGFILFAVILGSVRSSYQTNGLLGIFVGIITTGLVFFSLVNEGEKTRFPDLWGGFGVVATTITFLAGLVSVVAPRTNEPRLDRIPFRLWWNLTFGVLAVVYLPNLIQPSNGLLNLGDTTYHVLDEILAPIAGRVPYFDYSPQYTAAFGWFLIPIRWLNLSASHQMVTVLIACNIFIALIPTFLILLVRNVGSKLSRGKTLFAFMSIWCLSGDYDGSSIQLKEFSYFGRFLPTIVAIWALSKLNLQIFQIRKFIWASVLGLILGIALMNNPEFGVATLLSVLIGFILPTLNRQKRLSEPIIVVIVALSVPLAYFLIANKVMGFYSLGSLVGVRLRGLSIYESAMIGVVGPQLLYFAIAILSLAHGLRGQKLKGNSAQKNSLFQLEVTMGILMTLLALKFLARPIPQNLPQYFVLAFIAMTLVVIDTNFELPKLKRAGAYDILVAFPLSILILLPIGGLSQAPNPVDEYKRVLENHAGSTDWSSAPGRPADGWSPHALNEAYGHYLDRLKNIAAMLPVEPSRVGYFGIHGNATQIITGIENVVGIQAPESMIFGRDRQEVACLPLRSGRFDYVVAFDSDFPCSGYVEFRKSFDGRFVIYSKLRGET